jgi:drug/metabolite transporter (DMT)-like permease
MVFFWGSNITLVKVAIRNFQPLAFNCIRFTFASLTMLWLYRKVLSDRLEKKELLTLVLLGCLGNTVYQFFFIYGVQLTHVSHTAILLGTTPIFTAVLNIMTGYEKVLKRVWAGIILSFLGVLLIVFGGHDFQIGNMKTILGDCLILLATIVWSIYTTFSRNVVNRYSYRHFILYTMLFGALFIIPASIPSLLSQDWHILGKFEWVSVFYSALLALVFGYSAWYYGVEKIGSTRTSVYSNLTPVAGLLVGMIFLKERLSLLQWIGAAIVFCGLMLNRTVQRDVVVSYLFSLNSPRKMHTIVNE